jgi:membrane protease YdiL (CAAX protease family)
MIGVNMIDAQGIAALDRKIRFGSILLLFLAGLALSLVALGLCAVLGVPSSARLLLSVAVADLSWLGGYQLLAHDRDWPGLPARFATVRSSILWGCAAGAILVFLALLAIAKFLTWAGIELQPLAEPDFPTGDVRWLPAMFLVIAIIAPAAEELMTRGLFLDWLRQKMPVWPAILISALVFGLMHGIALHSGASGWLQLGYRTFLGIVMAYLTVRYRSLRPSFVFHASHNGFLVIASVFFP